MSSQEISIKQLPIIDEINTYGYDLDIVVEAKAKELAVLGWRQKHGQKNRPELAEV